MKFGDVALTTTPETIGLVRFTIKQAPNTIQSDCKLYGIFYTTLNILEIMVIAKTYDKIYQRHTAESDGSIYQELSRVFLRSTHP